MEYKETSDDNHVPASDVLRAESMDVLQTLARRWRWVVAGAMAGLVLAIVYCCVASTKFESKAQVLVMKKESSLPARGVEKGSETGTQVSEDLLATHMQIVQSPRIIRAALEKHGLEDLASIRYRLKKDEDEVEYIIDRLKVTRGGTGQARLANVLNISFRHVSAIEAQQILAAIVESYQGFLADKFEDVSLEASKLIGQANDQLGKDLEDAERAYQECREQTPLLWNGNVPSDTHQVNYERLQSALTEVRMQRATVKSRLDTVQKCMADLKGGALNDFDLLGLIDESHVERLGLLTKRGAADTAEFQATVPDRNANARAEYEGLLALAQKEQTLLADYGTEHPLVQDVRQQMAVTRGFLDEKSRSLATEHEQVQSGSKRLLASYVALLKNDMQTLAARQTELEQLSAAEEQAAKALVSSELRAETLRTQVGRKQELYQTVVDRLREVNLVKDYGGLVTEVIAPVELGEEVWPKVPLVLLLGTMVGLVLGSATAFGAEQLDRSLRTADELRMLTQLPVLMEMPVFHAPPVSVAERDTSGLSETLATHYRPKSFEAEVFRGLRTSLLFHGRGGDQRVVLCTSPNIGDGKSWVAANLATSIAQSGRRVLLLDADLRRPMVHRLFNLELEPGLSRLIAEEFDPPEAIQATAVENLWVISCGPLVDNPAELLSVPEFERCLQVYRDQYDYVIIDSPPLLAVSDPCIIAPLADAVLLTVRIGHDTRGQVTRAIELLDGIGANILGVVANGIDPGSKRRSSSHHYGFGRYASTDDHGVNGNGYVAAAARPTDGPPIREENAAETDRRRRAHPEDQDEES